MSDLHTTWKAKIRILSPLHIGSGIKLLLDYDLVTYQGQTYRVNEEALLEQALLHAEVAGAAEMNRLLSGRPAGELIEPSDFQKPVLFRYAMPGTPSSRAAGAQVQEQIKDVYDRLYLPGSSLKGALRTVLAWGFYSQQGQQPDLDRLGKSPKYATQSLEKDIFGSNPNRDWLRALHVEDSQPLPPEEHLALYAVRVYPTATAQSSGLDVDVEAIKEGATFQAALTVEEYGFQQAVAPKLGWQDKRAWLGQLVTLARSHAEARLQIEQAFFQSQHGPRDTLTFYDRLNGLLEGGLSENEFLLQLGWGTGWESKTLGSGLLHQDDHSFERLLQRYRMVRGRNRRIGDPFPSSRMLLLQGSTPGYPLGWVRVRLEGYEPGVVPELGTRGQEQATEGPPAEAPGHPRDLQPGQVLEGTVKHIANYGAFVDIGVGHNGLVHISRLAEGYVPNVEAVVRCGQRVQVRVLKVEWNENKQRWHIDLTMEGVQQP